MSGLFYIVPVIAGIFSGINFNFKPYFLISLVILSFFSKRKILIIFFVLFTLGNLSVSRIKKNGLGEINFENKKIKSLKCNVVSCEKNAPFSSTYVVECNGENFLMKYGKNLLLNMGEIIEIKDVKIKMISGSKNPWDFPSREYYKKRGILYTLYPEKIEIKGYKNFFYKSIAWIRKKGIDKVNRNLRYNPEERELIKTITLGQNEIPYFLKTLGIRSGSYHLLVISGLHISFLFLFLRIIFMPFRKFNNKHPKFFPFFTLLILWTYATITGLKIPVIRATFMFTFFLLGEIIEKEINGPNSITLAAILLLLLNPSFIFDLSFLLSFTTTYVIIMTVRKFNFVKNPLFKYLIITFFAQISSLPLILYNFGKFYPLGFISNIFLIPVCFTLVLLSFLSFIFPLLFSISCFFAKIFIGIMHVFSILTPEIIFYPSLSLTISFYLLLFFILLKNISKSAFLSMSALILLAFLSPFVSQNKNQTVKVYFFSAKSPCILFKNGNKGIFFTPDDYKNRNFLEGFSVFLRKERIKEIILISTEYSHLNPSGTIKAIKNSVYVKETWNFYKRRSYWEKDEYGFRIIKQNSIFRIQYKNTDIYLAFFLDKTNIKTKILYLYDYKTKLKNQMEELNPVVLILPARKKKYQIFKNNIEKFYIEDGCVILDLSDDNLKISQL